MNRWLLCSFAAASVAAAGAQAPAWKEASPGRAIVLPRDHASHPDYKIEWWYYTGNVDTEAGGRRFGYQLTFFRVGIDPAPANTSRWAVRDLFMAHLAVTDVNGKHYVFTDRVNRSGPGWAGAAVDRYRVWNDGWQAQLDEQAHVLRAGNGRFGVDLRLVENRAPVLHGELGYSRKGSSPGNASHYYSLTRMPTTGEILFEGERFAVNGSSWMDHEFGTSFLEPGQAGWDWFAIQLADGRDLMIFQLRRGDGSIDPRSSGTLVDADGRTTAITAESGFRLIPGRTWRSAATGARYPVEWQVQLPKQGLDLSVAAVVDGQELNARESMGVSYWEGAIDVRGSSQGRTAGGRGYLEMTGYTGVPMGGMLRGMLR